MIERLEKQDQQNSELNRSAEFSPNSSFREMAQKEEDPYTAWREEVAWGLSVFVEGNLGFGGVGVGGIQRWYVRHDGLQRVDGSTGFSIGGVGKYDEGDGAVSMSVNPLRLLELVTTGLALGSKVFVDTAKFRKQLEEVAEATRTMGQTVTMSAQIGITEKDIMFVRLNIGGNTLQLLKTIPQARPVLELLTKVASVNVGMGLQITEQDFGNREAFEKALRSAGLGPLIEELKKMRRHAPA